MHSRSLLFATVLGLSLSSVSHAQTSWSGTWKIVNGRCIDGLKVDAKEEPGVLVVTISGNDPSLTSERRVPLKADGSGVLEYDSRSFGRLALSVAPGQGKRTLKLTQQRTGVCQWRVEESVGNQ